MTGSKKPLPRRGTEPYAVRHAREVAHQWGVPVNVARCGNTFFCALDGAALDDAALVGRAIAGGRMFVYEGAPDGGANPDDAADAAESARATQPAGRLPRRHHIR